MTENGDVERYGELPEPTRRFLELLDADTISTLEKVLTVWRAANIVGRLVFVAGMFLFGVFAAVPAAIDGFRALMRWIGRGE